MRWRQLLDSPEVQVTEVSCGGHERRFSAEEKVGGPGFVLIRSGVFRRRLAGVETVFDPTVGFVQRPGEVQQIAHPAGGDICTSVTLSSSVTDRIAWRFAEAGWIPVSPRTDLTHRRFLARARRGADRVELADLASELVAAVLGEPGVPRGGAAQRRLGQDARAMLAATPDAGLGEISAQLGVSPWHLSRVFHTVNGITLSRYRARLRIRAAVDVLVRGEVGLAALAASLGFADQAHLTRSVRAETGLPPARLRAALTDPAVHASTVPR